MTTKKAVAVRAVVINAECPCGGSVIKSSTGSFDLDLDESDPMVCDTCAATITIAQKTVRTRL